MHSMAKRYAFNGERTVFVDYLLLVRVNSMEDNLKAESATESLEFKVQELLVLSRSIDVEWGSTAVQPKGAYHSHQAEHVVAVEMGYEYSIYLSEV